MMKNLKNSIPKANVIFMSAIVSFGTTMHRDINLLPKVTIVYTQIFK
jgi:hypothetical protein